MPEPFKKLSAEAPHHQCIINVEDKGGRLAFESGPVTPGTVNFNYTGPADVHPPYHNVPWWALYIVVPLLALVTVAVCIFLYCNPCEGKKEESFEDEEEEERRPMNFPQ